MYFFLVEFLFKKYSWVLLIILRKKCIFSFKTTITTGINLVSISSYWLKLLIGTRVAGKSILKAETSI
jgi:hypothetical protein